MNVNQISYTPPCWKRWGWLVVEVLLFIVIVSVISGILYFVTGLFSSYTDIKPDGTDMNNPFVIWSEAILAIGSIIALYTVVRLSKSVFPRMHPRAGLSFQGHIHEFLAGAGVAAGLYATGFLVILLTGNIHITSISFHASALGQAWIFFFFVALFEETMCRGFLLGQMMDAGINKFTALILSSTVFSILHFANPNFSVLPFINLLLAGILLGSAYIYTRNLWFAIALHWFWNWLQGPVLGFEVSGNNSEGSLLTLETTGHTLLHGGSFGFEGSLVCTLLMIISIALIIRYYTRYRKTHYNANL